MLPIALLCRQSHSDSHQHQKHACHPFHFHAASLICFTRLASELQKQIRVGNSISISWLFGSKLFHFRISPVFRSFTYSPNIGASFFMPSIQPPFAPFAPPNSHWLRQFAFERNYKAAENSSGETPAIFSALRSVPRATSRCMGMTQPRSPSVVIFLRTTWLPRWRSTKNPSRLKALTATVPETMGSLAMRQFKSVDRRRFPDGLRE